MFLDDTACNLASLNLLKFYDHGPARFDVEALPPRLPAVDASILEISVYMASSRARPIAQKSYDFRTLGLGYANLGTLLMVQGIPYDSPEGRASAAPSPRSCTRQSYATSAEIAGEVGPVPALRGQPRGDAARHPQPSPGRLQRSAASEYEGLTITPVGIDPRTAARLPARGRRREACDRMLELGEKHGYRNAQVTCIAPTGTIGLVMDCDTTGVEPDFALVKFKKLAGGGYFKIINASIPPALERARLHAARRSTTSSATAAGAARSHGCPHVNRASPQGQGLHRRGAGSAVEAAARRRLRPRLRLQPLDARRRLPRRPARPQRRAADRVARLRPARALGFTREQIAEANDYVCGTMTIEGAPHLKAEH